MTVDTKIYLPSYVAVNDIAKTRAVLAGGMVSIKGIGDTKVFCKGREGRWVGIQTLSSMHSALPLTSSSPSALR